MLRTITALLLGALLLGGCIKDQQAARTRNSGVDKEPEQREPAPKKLPVEEEQPPREPSSEELPPVEKPPEQPK